MGLFDELLQKAGDDRTVIEKYPEIKQWDERLAEWESWKANHYDPSTGMTRNALAAIQQRDAEIASLKLMAEGNDMTWDDMKGNVETLLKNSGMITRQQLETEVLPKLAFAKPDDLKANAEAIKNLERGMEVTYARTAHLPVQHMQEFGAPLKIQDLFQHMQEKKLTDFDQAYDSLVQPLRAKKNEEAQKTREEELVKKTREDALKEYTMKGGALPIDDRGGPPEATPLQRRIAERKKLEVAGPQLTPGALGDMAGANDAYQGWLRDQGGKRVQ